MFYEILDQLFNTLVLAFPLLLL